LPARKAELVALVPLSDCCKRVVALDSLPKVAKDVALVSLTPKAAVTLLWLAWNAPVVFVSLTPKAAVALD